MKIAIVGGVAGGASAAARARRLSEAGRDHRVRARARAVVRQLRPALLHRRRDRRPRQAAGRARSRCCIDRHRLDVRTRQSVEAIDRARKTAHGPRTWLDGTTYEESYDKLILVARRVAAAAADPGHRPAGHLHAARLCATPTACTTSHRKAQAGRRRRRRVHRPRNGREPRAPRHRDDRRRAGRPGAAAVGPRDDDADRRSTCARTASSCCWATRPRRLTPRRDGLVVQLKSRPRAAGRLRRAERRRAAGELAGRGGRTGSRPARRHSRQRAHADERSRHLRRRRRGRGPRLRHRRRRRRFRSPGPANRQGRIAADHIFGRDERVSRHAGDGDRRRVRHDGRDDRAEREGRCSARAAATRRSTCIRRTTPATIPAPSGCRSSCCSIPTDGKILGAQAVGGAGVDKRIDVLAMAIQAGMTVFDLEEAELAYAPQFGSAKDPINMAGFIAAGVVRGDVRVAHVGGTASTRRQWHNSSRRPHAGGVRSRPHSRRGQPPDRQAARSTGRTRSRTSRSSRTARSVSAATWPRGFSLKPATTPPISAAATRRIANSTIRANKPFLRLHLREPRSNCPASAVPLSCTEAMESAFNRPRRGLMTPTYECRRHTQR